MVFSRMRSITACRDLLLPDHPNGMARLRAKGGRGRQGLSRSVTALLVIPQAATATGKSQKAEATGKGCKPKTSIAVGDEGAMADPRFLPRSSVPSNQDYSTYLLYRYSERFVSRSRSPAACSHSRTKIRILDHAGYQMEQKGGERNDGRPWTPLDLRKRLHATSPRPASRHGSHPYVSLSHDMIESASSSVGEAECRAGCLHRWTTGGAY